MDSYVRPLIYQDTRGTCSSPIESNTWEQSKALNCPLAFFMWIVHMIYSIHRKHNSIFFFFKIQIIVYFSSVPNYQSDRHRKACVTLISNSGIGTKASIYVKLWYQAKASSYVQKIYASRIPTCRTSLPILATEATGCDRA